MLRIEKFLHIVKSNLKKSYSKKTAERYKIIYDSLPVSSEMGIYHLVLQYESADVVAENILTDIKESIQEMNMENDYGLIDYKILDHPNMRDLVNEEIKDKYEQFCNFFIANDFFKDKGWGCSSLGVAFYIKGLFATYNEIKYNYDEYSYSFIRRISEMEEKRKKKFIDAVIETFLNDDKDDVNFIRLRYDIEVYEGRL